MSFVFDGPNRKIRLTAGTIAVDVDDIYSRWYDWFLTGDNSKFLPAMRNVGGDPISDVKNLGITFFLINGWRIIPQSADHRLTIEGNLVTDPSGFSPIDTVPGYSIIVEYSVSNLVDSTLAQMPEIEYASFNECVTVDTINGFSGTIFPLGTPQRPVNNINDALQIANSRGFDTLKIYNDLTLDDSYNLNGFRIVGRNKNIELEIESIASVENLRLENLRLTDCVLDGGVIVDGCIIRNLYYYSGEIYNCGIAGHIELAGSRKSIMDNCFTFDQDDPVIIDMGGSGNDLAMPHYSGIVTIKNLHSETNEVGIGLDSGMVLLDETLTLGTVIVSGVGLLIDNSRGVAVNDFGLLNQENVVRTSWHCVHLNTDTGVSGSDFPTGTETYPVNNIVDARAIATRYGIEEICFRGDIVLQDSFENFTFRGQGHKVLCSIDLNNQLVDKVKFADCHVTGKLRTVSNPDEGWQSQQAQVQFDDCWLYAIEDLEGSAYHCQIEGLNKIRPGGWFSGIEIVVEGDFTFFDLRNTAETTVSMDISSGWAQFINTVDGCLIELNVKGGEISLDASCTGGEYYLEGIGTLFNDSAMVLKENHFPLDEPMNYHLISGSVGDALHTASLISDTTVAQAVRSELSAELLQIREIFTLHGLDPQYPLQVSSVQRTAGGTYIVQFIETTPAGTTVTRII